MSTTDDDSEREIDAMQGMLRAINLIGEDWATRIRIRNWFTTREQTLYEESERNEEYRKVREENQECQRLLAIAKKEREETELELVRLKELQAHRLEHPYSQYGSNKDSV